MFAPYTFRASRCVEAMTISPDGSEMIEDRNAQRAALFGIGRAAQFIQQHERIRRRLLNHRFNAGDVRRESAERLLNRLLVADVREHLIEDGELGFDCRNRKTRHAPSDARRPDGLHRYRLAAGIRSADEKNSLYAIQSQANRDDLLLLPP